MTASFNATNCTPHDVNVVDENHTLIKCFPTSKEHILRLEETQPVESIIDGIPVIPPPEYSDVVGDIPDGPIIVSMLVAQYLADKRPDVYGPDSGKGAVRDTKGVWIGTKRLVKYS